MNTIVDEEEIMALFRTLEIESEEKRYKLLESLTHGTETQTVPDLHFDIGFNAELPSL